MTIVLLILLACFAGASLVGFLFWFATKKIISRTRNVGRLGNAMVEARALELSLQDEYNRLSGYQSKFVQEHERLKKLPGRDALASKYSRELSELSRQMEEITKLAVPVLRERIVLEMTDILKPLEDGRLPSWDDMGMAHFDQEQIKNASKKMSAYKKIAQTTLRRLLAYRLPQGPPIVDEYLWAEVYTELVEHRESSRQYVQGVLEQIEMMTDRLHYIENRLERLEDKFDEHDALRERVEEIQVAGLPNDELFKSQGLLDMELQVLDIEGTLETHRRISRLLEQSKSAFPDSKD